MQAAAQMLHMLTFSVAAATFTVLQQCCMSTSGRYQLKRASSMRSGRNSICPCKSHATVHFQYCECSWYRTDANGGGITTYTRTCHVSFIFRPPTSSLSAECATSVDLTAQVTSWAWGYSVWLQAFSAAGTRDSWHMPGSRLWLQAPMQCAPRRMRIAGMLIDWIHCGN